MFYLTFNQINMRILYFHQYFKTAEASGATRSYEMAKFFVSKGHKVTMVFVQTEKNKRYSPLNGPFIKGQRRGSYEGIDLIEFNLTYSNDLNFIKRSILFISYAIRSIRLVKSEQYDLLFSTTTPLTAGLPGIAMKMMGIKKPFVFEVRDLWPELPREMGVIKNKFILWIMDLLESLSYNKSDACIALSPGIEKGIRKKLKKAKPVYLIPNGSDLDLFKPGHHTKTIFQGTKEDDIVAIFTGAHGVANGLDAALDAATVLKEKGFEQKIKLVFIGGGAMKKKLMNRAEKNQLSNCIFIDFVTKKELEKYLHAADIGLMLLANVPAFYYGTSPNKFFDYISIGLPVLNNYPGWLADMIEEYDCGIGIPPDEPEAFANALIALYEKQYDIPTMRINSRNLAEAKFGREKLAKQWHDAVIETYETYKTK